MRSVSSAKRAALVALLGAVSFILVAFSLAMYGVSVVASTLSEVGGAGHDRIQSLVYRVRSR